MHALEGGFERHASFPNGNACEVREQRGVVYFNQPRLRKYNIGPTAEASMSTSAAG